MSAAGFEPGSSCSKADSLTSRPSWWCTGNTPEHQQQPNISNSPTSATAASLQHTRESAGHYVVAEAIVPVAEAVAPVAEAVPPVAEAVTAAPAPPAAEAAAAAPALLSDEAAEAVTAAPAPPAAEAAAAAPALLSDEAAEAVTAAPAPPAAAAAPAAAATAAFYRKVTPAWTRMPHSPGHCRHH
ncbi:hypothetical protein FHG87_007464 [Trinorchestia longiramus]|nr:hypothetical protein FHG87_007464 [Trinorchestia longiramus]